MKQRKLILILAIVLSVAIAAGGTMAYLQDTDEDVNVMTLGNVYITQNEQERNEAGELVPFTQEKPMYPAVYEGDAIDYADKEDWPVPDDQAWQMLEDNENVIDKIVTVTNTGKSPAYVRTLIALEGTGKYGPNYADGAMVKYLWCGSEVGDRIAAAFEGEITVDGVDYTVISFTYVNELAPGETTIPSLKQLYLSKDAGNEEMEYYGEYYDVLVLSQAVQTQGFEDQNENGTAADEALNTAFGKAEVTENLIKWFSVVGDNVGSPGKDWPNNNPPVVVPENAEKAETVEAVMEALANGGVVEYTGEEDLVIDGFTEVMADTELYLNGAELVIADDATLFVEKIDLTIYDAKISAEAGDGQISVGNGATLTLGAGTVLSDIEEVPDSGLIKAYGGSDGNGKVVLDGAMIIGNSNSAKGSLINVGSDAEVLIEEGTKISNNVITAPSGTSNPKYSVINVNSGGLVTMNGGEITDNEYGFYGMITLQGGKFVMNGGIIADNTYTGSTASNAAVFYGFMSTSKIEMNGGKIDAGSVMAFNFGNISTAGAITINGGEVSCDSRFANVSDGKALVVGDDAVVNGSVYNTWNGTLKDVSEF